MFALVRDTKIFPRNCGLHIASTAGTDLDIVMYMAGYILKSLREL